MGRSRVTLEDLEDGYDRSDRLHDESVEAKLNDSQGEVMDKTIAPAAEPTVLVVEPAYSKREEVSTLPAVAKPANLMQALATAAVDPRMDVDKVERLWAMHKEMMDRESEAAFNDAMARAQAHIVPIAKDRRNDHTKSYYATLAAIAEAIVPIYTAEGLSVSFDQFNPSRDVGLPELEKSWVRVIAIVAHRGGHSRKYHLDGPLDDKGTQGTTNKTGIQAVGSTVSYLRRYLKCMIFNVATMDDNDGNASGAGKQMNEKVLADHLSAIEAADSEQALMKAFGPAWNAADALKDKDAQRRLTAHRDAQRKKLRTAA